MSDADDSGMKYAPRDHCPHGNEVGGGVICFECFEGYIDTDEYKDTVNEARREQVSYNLRRMYNTYDDILNDKERAAEFFDDESMAKIDESRECLKYVLDKLNPGWETQFLRKEEEQQENEDGPATP